MKGNPMKRNFGIGGSPMAMKNTPLKQQIPEAPEDYVASEGGGYKGLVEGEMNPHEAKNAYLAIEKQYNAGKISLEEAQKKYQDLEGKIAQFLKLLGATKNEKTGAMEYPVETSEKNIAILGEKEGELEEMIKQYNLLVKKQNNLAKQYEQRFYDYGTAYSDSTGVAQSNIAFPE